MDEVWAAFVGFAFGAGLVAFAMARGGRLSRAHVLDQPVRRRLAGLVKGRPGIRLGDLRRSLGLNRSTIQHHLALLEDLGVIQGVRQGGASRYFAADVDGHDADSMAFLLGPRVGQVVALVVGHPGWCQHDHTEALRMARKTFRLYANRLAARNLVKEERDKGRRRYYATPELERILALMHATQADEAGNDLPPGASPPGGPRP